MSTEVDGELVLERVSRIRAELRDVTDREIAIVAVTKTFGIDAMYAAQSAGCDAVGENYAQELVAKIESMDRNERGPLRIPIHFIGHVQSNKVKALAPHVSLWQTVDRLSVIDEIAKRAPASTHVLIQVNTTGETTKDGCSPSDAPVLVDHARGRGLDVRGLMTIGPTGGSRGEIESAFRGCRTLADSLGLPECSMGMSGDYLLAAECGSTMVRLGSVLFGARDGHP